MEFIDIGDEKNDSGGFNVLPIVRRILGFEENNNKATDPITLELIDFLQNGVEGEVVFDESKPF